MDVIQNIRKLTNGAETIESKKMTGSATSSRNYKIRKDFDSIEKMEFLEMSFKEIMELMENNIAELDSLDDIKAKILVNAKDQFEAILVNRNKINNESTLKINIPDTKSGFTMNYSSRNECIIKFTIETGDYAQNEKSFVLMNDDYDLFWNVLSNSFSRDEMKISRRSMVEIMWKEWLESVGIEY